MDANIKKLLEAPFKPEEIKERKGSYGKMLSYIEYTSIVKRLNSLDVPWSFKVISHQIVEDECVCLGELYIELDGGITKHGFGSKKVTRSADGKALNIGDDYKSSSSSALRKAASLLGMGLYLYDSPAEEAVEKKTEAPADNGNGRGSSGGNGSNGSGNKATNAQIRAVVNLSKYHKVSSKDMAGILKSVTGESLKIDDLSKAQASLVIKHLQTFAAAA